MYEKSEGGYAPLPPAADAHAYVVMLPASIIHFFWNTEVYVLLQKH